MGRLWATCAAGLLLPFLLLLAAPANADTEIPLFTAQREACDINATATSEWRTIIFRITPRPSASRTCVETQNDTAGLITLAFATLSIKRMDTDGATYRSILLGRLIDYEWLSRQLSESAGADANWSATTGKARDGERAEAYVQRSLATPPVLDPLSDALKPYGYRAGGFSCEKAMISGPDTKPFQPAWVAADKRLPFDALCHLVLKPLE
jgi:hypothetical protein